MQNKGKKILIITKHYPPKIDGVGDHSYQLANRLKGKGYNVEVVTATENADTESIVYVNRLSGFKDLKELFRIVNRSNPNAILFQYVSFSYNLKGLTLWLIPFFFYLRRKNLKLLLFVHETFERRRIKLKHHLLELLQKVILYNLCQSSDAIFTSNRVYAKQLAKFNQKLFITRTPSNFEKIEKINFSPSPKEDVVLRFAYFGNRDFKKTLVIFKELYALNNNIFLKIIGKIHSSHLEQLENKEYDFLRKHIEITGLLSSEQIIEEINKCDAYILPEYVGPNEDGGLNTKSGTTATGFMLGKIVVSTKGDMTEDFFKDMINCVLIDTNLPKEASSKILLAINHSRDEIQRNAFDLYHEHLSWSNTINTILKQLC